MAGEIYHIPALLPEVLEALDVHPDGIYVDATFGGGGHSKAILARLADGHLYSFDQDYDALANAPDDSRFTFVYSNFRFLSNFMRFYGVDSVDGILADLGVSFHHFDSTERGFSFRFDAPLDMRMNRRASTTAADILEHYAQPEIARMFSLYGELRQGARMAAAIVKEREAGRPVDSVSRLIEVCRPYISPRQEKKELAQLFQALRIEVNGEMEALVQFLNQTVRMLRPGGRLVVITYHSLEDRLVKNFMRSGNVEGTIEKDFFGRVSAPLKPLGSKPVVPSEEEIERNPRSRSAKLRVAVKL